MKKKLTILHINCNYMTTKLHQLMIQHFNNLNNIVFAPISKKTQETIIPDNNVYVSKCFNKIDRISFFYKQRKIYKSIEKMITNINNIDCIHAYTLFTDGNIAYKLFQKYNIPYFVAIRDTDVNAFYKYRFYLRKRGNIIMKNATKVFFLSEAYKEQVINKYILKDLRQKILQKSIIIPNGIDDFWLNNIYYDKNLILTNERIKKRQIRLLFVGQIIKRKNIELILKAINKLKNMEWNVTLDVVGKINDKKLFNKLCKNKYFNYAGEKTKKNYLIFIDNTIYL